MDISSEDLDVSRVVQAALDGDASCRTAIAHAGEHIGVALAGLVNLVNPSLVLLDGGVVRAGELLLEPIRRACGSAEPCRCASRYSRIATGALSDNAIALGGVVTVIDAAFGPSSPAPLPPRSASLLETSALCGSDAHRAARDLAVGLHERAIRVTPALNLAFEGHFHLSP